MRVWIIIAIGLFAGAAQADSGRVWVAPFTEANQDQPSDWIGRAIWQSVSDDLSSVHGVSPTTQPSDADFVVSGTIQRVAGELRVTGRIEDTSSNKIIGGFKATGGDADLFAIEDSIAQQVKAVLAPQSVAPAQAPAPPAAQAPAPAPAPAAVPAGAFEGSELQRALEERDYLRRLAARTAVTYPPVETYAPPAYPYDYGYGYGYGGYPYSPYWGGGIWWGWGGSNVVIINGGGRHHHRHDNNGTRPVMPTPTPLPSDNGQRIRQVASYSGNPPSILLHQFVTPPKMVIGK